MNDSDFHYVGDVAKAFGNLCLLDEINAFVDSVSPSQLEQLRTAYSTIEARGDAFPMSRWIDDCFERKAVISKRESDFADQVLGLLRLFAYFARRGILPFASGTVEYVEQTKKPNWANLPKRLHYLIAPAEAFSAQESETAMLEFLDQAHSADMELLAKTAERMRMNQDWPTLDEWLNRHPFTKHPEAWMVYTLIGIMDHAGLEFQAPL